ncbi:MAG: hypothetical protein HUJ29_02170, partial [Gammaproteobacteria bacterium]|nr:hypothetical protein [Gammaproteobacteria bacterium]
ALYHAQAITLDGHLDSSDNLTPEVIKGMLVQANSRYFAVFFWFALLGPVGAVLARLLPMLEQWSRPEENEGKSFESGLCLATRRLRNWMEWPVVRLVALGFGISGSFVDFWQTAKNMFLADSRELLTRCGFASVQLKYHLNDDGGMVLNESPQDSEQEKALILDVRDLLRRTIMFGLAVLALLTLYGLLI